MSTAAGWADEGLGSGAFCGPDTAPAFLRQTLLENLDFILLASEEVYQGSQQKVEVVRSASWQLVAGSNA